MVLRAVLQVVKIQEVHVVDRTIVVLERGEGGKVDKGLCSS